MPYTEMDNITPAKLALISERARKDPKFQFTSLAHLLNEGFLKECYYQLGRDRASGIDGVRKGFEAYLEHYPLPEPRIVHYLYTLSFVS